MVEGCRLLGCWLLGRQLLGYGIMGPALASSSFASRPYLWVSVGESGHVRFRVSPAWGALCWGK